MSQPVLPKTPWWMTAIIIVAALPVFSFPALLDACPPDLKALVWVYPFYIVAAAYLAWQCWPQRPALAWVLVGLTVLSHGAVWLMVTSPLVTY